MHTGLYEILRTTAYAAMRGMQEINVNIKEKIRKFLLLNEYSVLCNNVKVKIHSQLIILRAGRKGLYSE